MVLPNFLIVGAMKAGTSWLAYNISHHPDVFVPKEELHFFNWQSNFAKGRGWYEQQFAGGAGKKAIGEKTAGYLLGRPEPSFIKAYLDSDVKIIAVLRDPVTRAVSQINHHIRYGDISPFLPADNLIGTSQFAKIDKQFAILERGNYYHQVKDFRECFGAANMLIVVNEIDIKQQAQATLQKTCEFLAVDPNFEFMSQDKKVHVNRNSKLGVILSYQLPALRSTITKLDRFIPGPKATPFKLGESDTQKLYAYYKKSNQQLFEFLGRDMPTSWNLA